MTPIFGTLARNALSIVKPGTTGGGFPAFSGVDGLISHVDGEMTAAGVRIDERGALRIAAVWIANTLLADEVSSVSWRLLDRTDTKRLPVRTPQLPALWGAPNSDQTQQGIIATETMSIGLSGCVIEMLGWDRGGRLTTRWPLDPTGIKFERPEPGVLRITDRERRTLTNRPGALPEFMFIPRYTLPGRIDPVSPVRVAAELAGLSASYDRMAARFAGRGFNPSAILTVGEKVEAGDAKELSSRIERLHGGSNNAGGVAVIGGKDAKVERYSMSMVDAQFVAQQDRVFKILLAMWRVPATAAGMVDQVSTWGTGVAEFSRGLERFTLRPIVELLQSGYEKYITAPVSADLQWRGVFDSMLSASPKERSEIQRMNLMNGMTSVERILAQNDEPPFEPGETRFSSLALITAEDRLLDRVKKAGDAAAALIAAGVPQDAAYRAVGLNADGTLMEA